MQNGEFRVFLLLPLPLLPTKKKGRRMIDVTFFSLLVKAIDLGMNRDADKWKDVDGRDLFTPVEKQIRKQIWGACCVADKLSTFSPVYSPPPPLRFGVLC